MVEKEHIKFKGNILLNNIEVKANINALLNRRCIKVIDWDNATEFYKPYSLFYSSYKGEGTILIDNIDLVKDSNYIEFTTKEDYIICLRNVEFIPNKNNNVYNIKINGTDN